MNRCSLSGTRSQGKFYDVLPVEASRRVSLAFLSAGMSPMPAYTHTTVTGLGLGPGVVRRYWVRGKCTSRWIGTTTHANTTMLKKATAEKVGERGPQSGG